MEIWTNSNRWVGPPDQAARPEPRPRGGDRYLSRKEVLPRTGIGKTLMYELLEEGDFPKPRALGGRRIGWLESEIDEWVANRKLAPREPRGKGPKVAA